MNTGPIILNMQGRGTVISAVFSDLAPPHCLQYCSCSPRFWF